MSHLVSRLALLKAALQYLDQNAPQNVENIKRDASKYTNSDVKGLICKFSINIDLAHVMEQNDLGAYILGLPLESATIFQEVISQFCRDHHLLPANTTMSQVCARLRITQFPSDFQSLQIVSIADLTKYMNYKGFVRLLGLVTGMSAPAKYTQSTKYVCPHETCDGHTGNHFVRMHTPGASERKTVRNDFTCLFCATTLEEMKSLRTLSDKIIIEVIPIRLESCGQREVIDHGRQLQAVPVLVRDELISAVELGNAYEIVGICCTEIHGEDITMTLELQRCLPPQMGYLPSALQEIYNNCLMSPWSFPLNVAYRFGDAITPGGVMMKLRLLLLMSLVLDPKERFLHVLCLGEGIHLAQSLMTYARQFAVRDFPASQITPLNGKVVTDKYTWAPYFIQCGSLALSSGGVYAIGDVTGWKKAAQEQIQGVLTSSKIFLGLACKQVGGLSQQVTCPLRSQIWGSYDPVSSGVKAATQTENILGSCGTGDLTKSFLDAFSYICFLDSGDSVTQSEILTETTHHTLISWCEPEIDGSTSAGLDASDLEHFLTLARHTETKLSPEAETLIQNYYTASRRARTSGLSGSDVPPSALSVIKSLAIAFAKLKLKPAVDEYDSLMAVFLYEESLAARHGLSVLSIQPQPHISQSGIGDFLGKQNDLMMQQFHVQLLRFCARAMDDYSLTREE